MSGIDTTALSPEQRRLVRRAEHANALGLAGVKVELAYVGINDLPSSDAFTAEEAARVRKMVDDFKALVRDLADLASHLRQS